MKGDTFYEAHWYDPKDCMVDGVFDPYITTVSSHDNLNAAKTAAVKGAAKGDFFHGYARVETLIETCDGQYDFGPSYVNEVWKGKWGGYEVSP